jgi:hypothetical protein
VAHDLDFDELDKAVNNYMQERQDSDSTVDDSSMVSASSAADMPQNASTAVPLDDLPVTVPNRLPVEVKSEDEPTPEPKPQISTPTPVAPSPPAPSASLVSSPPKIRPDIRRVNPARRHNMFQDIVAPRRPLNPPSSKRLTPLQPDQNETTTDKTPVAQEQPVVAKVHTNPGNGNSFSSSASEPQRSFSSFAQPISSTQSKEPHTAPKEAQPAPLDTLLSVGADQISPALAEDLGQKLPSNPSVASTAKPGISPQAPQNTTVAVDTDVEDKQVTMERDVAAERAAAEKIARDEASLQHTVASEIRHDVEDQTGPEDDDRPRSVWTDKSMLDDDGHEGSEIPPYLQTPGVDPDEKLLPEGPEEPAAPHEELNTGRELPAKEESVDLYDTKAYHMPLTPKGGKARSSLKVVWMLLVVIIIAVAAIAVYFLYFAKA